MMHPFRGSIRSSVVGRGSNDEREKTASVRYDLDLNSRNLSAILDIFDPAHYTRPPGKAGRLVFGALAQGLKSGEKGLSALASGTSAGAVDFSAGTCLIHRRFLGSDHETYYRPGQVLQRSRGGSWRERGTREINGSAMFSPVWLVELLRGAIDARHIDDQTSDDGQPMEGIRAVGMPQLASAGSVHGMALPELRPEVEYPIPLDERLDSERRLVRLVATFPSGEPDDVVKEWTNGSVELCLSNFGRASVPASPLRT
jgi:hypothetical protein